MFWPSISYLLQVVLDLLLEMSLQRYIHVCVCVCVCVCIFAKSTNTKHIVFQATRSVLTKEAPGLTIAMISGSLAITKLAMLSR